MASPNLGYGNRLTFCKGCGASPSMDVLHIFAVHNKVFTLDFGMKEASWSDVLNMAEMGRLRTDSFWLSQMGYAAYLVDGALW